MSEYVTCGTQLQKLLIDE